MRGTVDVWLWGTHIGSLGYAPGETQFASFEFTPDFVESGMQLSPIHLHHPPRTFLFNDHAYRAFQGLPGFIADSLPDTYGNQLIDIYMAEKRIPADQVTALDRLSYVSNRGMGALEYQPGETLALNRGGLDLQNLAELAELVKQRKELLHKKLHSSQDRALALTMIRIGSSAGGARSKALLAISPRGNLLDGTVNHGPDYSYWVLKFDSPSNRDKDNLDPRGLPVLEYIYSLIARKAGIDIPKTDLISDGETRHFLIERFDRIVRKGKLDKIHYVSWAGMAHADRDGVNSYEQLILLARQLQLGHGTEVELFRRAVFNLIGRNQDDHTKNSGFLMDRSGTWRLSPAFDLVYSYDPSGRFTKEHQTVLNGKRGGFEPEDLFQFGRFCNLSEKEIRNLITQVADAFSSFPKLAKEYSLSRELTRTVTDNWRLSLAL